MGDDFFKTSEGTEQADDTKPAETANNALASSVLNGAVLAEVEVDDVKSDIPPPPPADDGRFDWSTDDRIIIVSQPSVAVYRNAADGVTIRQERQWHEDVDPIIILSSDEAVELVITALAREIGLDLRMKRRRS